MIKKWHVLRLQFNKCQEQNIMFKITLLREIIDNAVTEAISPVAAGPGVIALNVEWEQFAAAWPDYRFRLPGSLQDRQMTGKLGRHTNLMLWPARLPSYIQYMYQQPTASSQDMWLPLFKVSPLAGRRKSLPVAAGQSHPFAHHSLIFNQGVCGSPSFYR